MSKVIVIQCKNLQFNSLYKMGKDDLFYRAMVYQGQNYFNFRYTSPEAQDSLLQQELKKIYKKDFLHISSADDIVQKKKKYCIYFNYEIKKKADHQKFQKECQSIFDKLDSLGLLEDAYAVLVGYGKSSDKKEQKKYFKKTENKLTDQYLHAPLIIYCPNRMMMDIPNCCSVENLIRTIADLKNNKEQELLSFLNEPQKRWDVYSFYETKDYAIGGLRGPMFQYYAFYNKKMGKIEHQECYDLNNDYSMTANLIPQNLDSKIVAPVVEEYGRRVLKFIKGKLK